MVKSRFVFCFCLCGTFFLIVLRLRWVVRNKFLDENVQLCSISTKTFAQRLFAGWVYTNFIVLKCFKQTSCLPLIIKMIAQAEIKKNISVKLTKKLTGIVQFQSKCNKIPWKRQQTHLRFSLPIKHLHF